MSKDYTQFDWASDRLARSNWEDAEERLFKKIDKGIKKNKKKK